MKKNKDKIIERKKIKKYKHKKRKIEESYSLKECLTDEEIEELKDVLLGGID